MISKLEIACFDLDAALIAADIKVDRIEFTANYNLGGTTPSLEDFKKLHNQLCITDIGNVHTDGVSKVFITILASLAEIERTNISERIKASKEIAKQERRYLGGYSEFGYKVEKDNKLIADDKEFKMLQSMISLRKSGLGYRQISDEIKNKYGKRIYFPQVHKILNRPHNGHF